MSTPSEPTSESTAQRVFAAGASALGAAADNPAAAMVSRLQKETDALKEGGGIFQHNILPSLFKLLRTGTVGVASPAIGALMGLAAAPFGIPADDMYGLVSSINVGTPSQMWDAFKERWIALRKKYSGEWDTLSTGGKIKEGFKRLGSLIANPISGALSGVPVFVADLFGTVGTLFGGVKLLNSKIEGTVIKDLLSNVPMANLILGQAGNAENAVNAIQDAVNYSSNFFGYCAKWLAERDFFKKHLSAERLEKMRAAGDPLNRAYGGGMSGIISGVASSGAVHELGRSLGLSEEHFTKVQKLLSPVEEAIKTFIPGFKIENAKSFMEFANTVKSTFGSAVTALGNKYQANVDFEKVTLGVKDLLGFKGSALDGVKKALGEQALGTSFETIRAKGDNMVAVAQAFVGNIQNKNLQEKIGYTMAAGNVQDALQALVAQKAAPDFIAKIHTLQIKDVSGHVLRTLNSNELGAFKKEALNFASQAMSAPTAENRPAASRPDSL